ncbi:MAG: glycine zipper domain-containing protein [bacterium]|jgi:uncharacterized protein YcfJ
MMMKSLYGLVIAAALGFTVAACTPAQKGATVGGAAGAIGGQLIGGNTESTLIGGAVGALGGAMLNDHIDRQKRDAYEEGYYEGRSRGYTPRYERHPQPYYNTAPR